MITFDTLVEQINTWADEHGAGEAASHFTQLRKVHQEVDALSAAMSLEGATPEEMVKMGDTIVALVILCKQRGYQADTCLNLAYNKIKNIPVNP